MTYEEAGRELLRIKSMKQGNAKGENLTTEKFVITFCGAFSAGKSSLLNYLLTDGKENFFPTGINPVTSLVTKIKYGNPQSFSYLYQGKRVYVDYNDFCKIITGEEHVPDEVETIEVRMDSPILKRKVVFIDTPGFEEKMGGKLERISKDAVFNADMVVVCMNATRFGSEFEQTFLEELEGRNVNCCLVVNKMDCLNSAEDEVLVKERAEKIIGDREGMLLEQKLFYTIAAGEYRNVFDFASYLSKVIGDFSLRGRIQERKAIIAGIYACEKLGAAVSLEYVRADNELSKIKEEHERLRKELDQNQAKRDILKSEEKLTLVKKLCGMLDQTTSVVADAIRGSAYLQGDDSYVHDEEIPFYTLESLIQLYGSKGGWRANFGKSYHGEFPSVVAIIYSAHYHHLAIEFEKILEKHLQENEILSLFESELQKFRVPSPIGKRVKKRNMVGQVWQMFVEWEYDDGYDMEYNDFKAEAINKIRTELLPKLQRLTEKSVERYCDLEYPTLGFDTGLEREVDKKQEEIDKWGELMKEIQSIEVRMTE